MAPEQVAGASPDERSEVFSIGVLAYEILAGKSPYTATTMESLFREITSVAAPQIRDAPEAVEAIVRRALDKEPAARWQSMATLRDAIAAERKRRFAPAARRWPLVAALALLVVCGALGVWWWRVNRAAPLGPGDVYVRRALEEYNVFYNDKALSSLRAALREAPDHPRANAYMILFGGAPPEDRAAAIAAASRARGVAAARTKDRALLEAAITYTAFTTSSSPRRTRRARPSAGSGPRVRSAIRTTTCGSPGGRRGPSSSSSSTSTPSRIRA
jgi:hypothetical protein